MLSNPSIPFGGRGNGGKNDGGDNNDHNGGNNNKNGEGGGWGYLIFFSLNALWAATPMAATTTAATTTAATTTTAQQIAISPFLDDSGNQNIGAIIHICQKIRCLPYAGFLKAFF